jgi:hypothetical protein
MRPRCRYGVRNAYCDNSLLIAKKYPLQARIKTLGGPMPKDRGGPPARARPAIQPQHPVQADDAILHCYC